MHPGTDLYGPAGMEVLAVEAGVVVQICNFVNLECHKGRPPRWLVAIQISHGWFSVIYGEVSSPKVKVGYKVYEGQPVAEIGNQGTDSQLHFEFYETPGIIGLRPDLPLPFRRVPNPVDAAPYLHGCVVQKAMPMSGGAINHPPV